MFSWNCSAPLINIEDFCNTHIYRIKTALIDNTLIHSYLTCISHLVIAQLSTAAAPYLGRLVGRRNQAGYRSLSSEAEELPAGDKRAEVLL